MIIAPKVMYKVSALSKSPLLFCRDRKIYFKIHMESQEIQIAKTTLKKKNKIESLKLLNLRTYCRDSTLPNAGGPGSVCGQGTRSHVLQLRCSQIHTYIHTYIYIYIYIKNLLQSYSNQTV